MATVLVYVCDACGFAARESIPDGWMYRYVPTGVEVMPKTAEVGIKAEERLICEVCQDRVTRQWARIHGALEEILSKQAYDGEAKWRQQWDRWFYPGVPGPVDEESVPELSHRSDVARAPAQVPATGPF